MRRKEEEEKEEKKSKLLKNLEFGMWAKQIHKSVRQQSLLILDILVDHFPISTLSHNPNIMIHILSHYIIPHYPIIPL